MRLDALANRFHDLEVDAEQIVAAHARLARDAGGDDAHVRAGDIGVIGAALEVSVEIVDRSGLGDVERFALGNPFRDVEQDDVAKLAHRGEVSEGAADHSSADQRDLFPSHGAGSNLSVAAAASWGVAAWGARRPISDMPSEPQPTVDPFTHVKL